MCSMDVACMENADHSAPGDQEFRVAGPIHLLQLPLIVALATGAEPPAPDGDGVATLDAVVVVVSSRVPEPLSQVVASVAQVEREELRSEEHTSELQSLMRISYAVFCLKKKNKT